MNDNTAMAIVVITITLTIGALLGYLQYGEQQKAKLSIAAGLVQDEHGYWVKPTFKVETR